MLYTHFTEELLGLQGVNITNIESSEKSIEIYAELERKPHNCTSCGTATSTVVRFPFKLCINLDTFFAAFDICDVYPLQSE